MVGVEAESEGIIRAGAEMVEAMACATVPKIIVTLNHASGAGYYAMAGQGFDPNFTFAWPTARIGVMEGDAAVQAVHGPELERYKSAGQPVPPEIEARIAQTRADYERWLDARYAAARGHVDAIIDPLETRRVLEFALEAATAGRHREHLPVELTAMSLRVEQDGRVRRLTLAAPARRNMLDAALAAQLLNELRDAQAHRGYRRDSGGRRGSGILRRNGFRRTASGGDLHVRPRTLRSPLSMADAGRGDFGGRRPDRERARSRGGAGIELRSDRYSRRAAAILGFWARWRLRSATGARGNWR